MSTGWNDVEPAPMEFFHATLIKFFHEWRRGKNGDNNPCVLIDGIEFSNIVAKAKIETYEKYPNQNLQDVIPKSEM